MKKLFYIEFTFNYFQLISFFQCRRITFAFGRKAKKLISQLLKVNVYHVLTLFHIAKSSIEFDTVFSVFDKIEENFMQKVLHQFFQNFIKTIPIWPHTVSPELFLCFKTAFGTNCVRAPNWARYLMLFPKEFGSARAAR